jgi:hypothetical protein
MPISYSYPQRQPELSTLLIGTQHVTNEGMVTANYSVSDLGQFIVDEFIGVIPTPFITSITTTGTTGVATVSGGVLNVPNYDPTIFYTDAYFRLSQVSGILSVTVQSNNTTYTWVFTRTGPGVFTVTISGNPLNFNNLWYSLTDNIYDYAQGFSTFIKQTGTNTLTIYSLKNGSGADDLLSNTPLHIRIIK